MKRRDLVVGAAAVAAARRAWAAEEQGFDSQTVRRMARELAATPYRAPDTKLPGALANLTYDAYRDIRFDPAQALWHGMGLPFEAQFFHRGLFYTSRVDIYEVADGKARPVVYRPEMFSFGANAKPEPSDLGFAGFRLHAPINRADYYDEVGVFLGASYFRAVGKNQGYGLSARGLSLKTANSAGEEFPVFRAFWLERPQPGTNLIVVTALLDSVSTTAAMRFTIRPGETTTYDVEATVYPRVDLTEAGVGTGTSMFYFDASDRTGIDDYRRAVHDSDGLMMLTGRGEELWRQLANPRTLQISAFADTSPRGFGLMQRKRRLEEYEDLEAHYERRPGLWVEPIGDWGDGVIELVEIPTKGEVNDNIAAFWRPKQPLRAKSEVNFTYRLHWGAAAAIRSDLVRFVAARSGASTAPGSRLFVLDVVGDKLKALPPGTAVRATATTDKGKVQNVVAQPDPETGGWRISFELLPDGDMAELRARLMAGDVPLSESWVYRWTV